MSSNVSPSAVAPSSELRAARPAVEREVAAQFEALLLRTALAPVAKAIGFYGDIVVDEASRRIARGVP